MDTLVLPKTGIASEHWLQRRTPLLKTPAAKSQTRRSVQHLCKDGSNNVKVEDVAHDFGGMLVKIMCAYTLC